MLQFCITEKLLLRPDIILPQNSSISRDYVQLLVLPWAYKR